MTRPLFREKAVEHRARSRREGRVVQWRDALAARMFVALLAFLALSAATSFAVRVEEVATGTFTVGQGRDDAVLLLPIGAAPRLRPGQGVRLDVVGTPVSTRVAEVGVPRTENGVTYAVVTVRVRRGGAATGRATVVLARHPLAVALVPSLGRR